MEDNNYVGEMNEETEVTELVPEDTSNGNVTKKIIIGAATVATLGLGGLVYKKLKPKIDEKLNERRVRKLEKAGWRCFREEDLVDCEDECESEED